MMDKVKEIINPTEDQLYQRYLTKFRKENIPQRYNQVKLLDELNNPNIDHYISISTRTDGKSFNYVNALLHIGIEYNLGLFFLSRKMTLRDSYQTLINEIIDVNPKFKRNDFTFIRNQYYVALTYKGKDLAVISDLNNATELKQFSNYLKKFPIIIYDEFLALEDDYLPDEWLRLKTIYESIDRQPDRPLINSPKIFYLGNAVNFSSPILSGLQLFNTLENHPINTLQIYSNIALEMHKNENANEERNTRAFDSADDAMSTGQFETNNHHIATETDKQRIKMNPRVFYVKLKSDYLKVWFNRDTFETVLSIQHQIEGDYVFNIQLKDNREDSTYLNDKYFGENHIKKIDRGAYLFDNTYSKNYITQDFSELNTLKINKLIREVLTTERPTDEIDNKEQQFKENYIEQTKRGLMTKFWG